MLKQTLPLALLLLVGACATDNVVVDRCACLR